MRSPTLAVGALLLAVPLLALGMSVRPAAAAPKPKISSVTLSLRQIRANGEPVQVTALVNANNASISSVTATTNLKQTVTLTSSAAGRYTGTVNIPANTSKKSRSIKVTVKVQYGNKSISKASPSATQLGGATSNPGGGDGPPPPPPI